jgi:hypothetical protein
MTESEVIRLATADLQTIVASTNPGGRYAAEYRYAVAELARRDADPLYQWEMAHRAEHLARGTRD